jgi:hypothetical protein
MKLPMGILKSGGHSDNHLDLEYVFQSERATNEKKKVDFELEDGSEFTQSVFDSQRSKLVESGMTTNGGAGVAASLLQSSNISNCKVLQKFLRRNFNESLDLIETNLSEKMLIEFPVFALNEDYMKALSITIQNKIDHIKNIIEEK